MSSPQSCANPIGSQVEIEEIMLEKFGNTKSYTAPYDPRFPNTNQTKNCYQNYLDYHRCIKKRGEDFEACKYFKRIYKSLCPDAWIEKWDGQIAEGIFAGRI